MCQKETCKKCLYSFLPTIVIYHIPVVSVDLLLGVAFVNTIFWSIDLTISLRMYVNDCGETIILIIKFYALINFY